MTLYNLPLEILDIILQKSYFQWILNSPTKQKEEEAIRALISVDVCFNRRIINRRRRFKKAICGYLRNFNENTMKSFAILRNNRKYFLENIKPNNELISTLLSLNCISQKESDLIHRQHFDRDKNYELLNVTRLFDKERLSNFIKCLRQTNQKTVARIIESGGGVIKVKVKNRGEKCAASMKTAKLHQNIEDLQSRAKPWSQRTDRLTRQLRQEGIEIVNSHLDRQSVVVWIWCHSQAALKHMQRLYESNKLRDNIFLEFIEPSSSMMIKIDRNQFKKTVVVCPMSVNLTQILRGWLLNGEALGVTKLKSEIYVLYRRPHFYGDNTLIIYIHDNRLRLRKAINLSLYIIKDPFDIEASEKDDCLYVSESKGKCVWRISRETADEYKINKWLTTDYEPFTMSVSNDGQLLILNYPSSILMIYGSDAELIRSIQLPADIEDPHHAVKTSIGNFIICHMSLMDVKEIEEMEEENHWETNHINRIKRSTIWVISELTGDGQMVVRRFIPCSATQEIDGRRYLSLDSYDQVFMGDYRGMILLDSNLRWNRTLLTDAKKKIQYPRNLCYDDENKQLIVVSFTRVNVYSITRT